MATARVAGAEQLEGNLAARSRTVKGDERVVPDGLACQDRRMSLGDDVDLPLCDEDVLAGGSAGFSNVPFVTQTIAVPADDVGVVPDQRSGEACHVGVTTSRGLGGLRVNEFSWLACCRRQVLVWAEHRDGQAPLNSG